MNKKIFSNFNSMSEEEENFSCIKCGYTVDVSNDLDLEKEGMFVCHRCVAEYIKEVLLALD